MTGHGRRGLVLVLGSGLGAGFLAALIGWFLPEQYQSICELRRNRAAIPLLQYLEVGTDATALRILLAGREVRLAVASAPGLLSELGFNQDEQDQPRFVRFYEEHVSVIPVAEPNTLFVIGRHQDPILAARLANEVALKGRSVLSHQVAERRALKEEIRKRDDRTRAARVERLQEEWAQESRKAQNRLAARLAADIRLLESEVAASKGSGQPESKSARTALDQAQLERRRLRWFPEGRPDGLIAARIEAELRVLMEETETHSLSDLPPGGDPEPWFIQSQATPGQHATARLGLLPVLVCALFASALSALFWLAQDGSHAG